MTAMSPWPETMASAAPASSATSAAGMTPTTHDSTASLRVRAKRAKSPAVAPANANRPTAMFTPAMRPMASAGSGT